MGDEKKQAKEELALLYGETGVDFDRLKTLRLKAKSKNYRFSKGLTDDEKKELADLESNDDIIAYEKKFNDFESIMIKARNSYVKIYEKISKKDPKKLGIFEVKLLGICKNKIESEELVLNRKELLF